MKIIFRFLSALALIALILGMAIVVLFQPMLIIEGDAAIVSAAGSTVIVRISSDETKVLVHYSPIEGHKVNDANKCWTLVSVNFKEVNGGSHLIKAKDTNGQSHNIVSLQGIEDWNGNDMEGMVVCFGDNMLITK